MKKPELIGMYNQCIKTFKLDPKGFVLAGVGAMVMHDLRIETDSINISCAVKEFNALVQSKVLNADLWGGKLVTNHHSGLLVITVGVFKIHLDEAINDDGIVDFDGVIAQSIENILSFKRGLNRAVDFLDIGILEASVISNAPPLNISVLTEMLKDLVVNDSNEKWRTSPAMMGAVLCDEVSDIWNNYYPMDDIIDMIEVVGRPLEDCVALAKLLIGEVAFNESVEGYNNEGQLARHVVSAFADGLRFASDASIFG